jgi:hypothetical protein
MTIQPRLLRLRDAPTYLGMNINYFNAEVRPHLVTIRIGKQGIAFDRLDLDAFAERYKQQNLLQYKGEEPLWNSQNSSGFGRIDASKSKISDEEFDRILSKNHSTSLLG